MKEHRITDGVSIVELGRVSPTNESPPTVWELPVADVLQVGPGVLAHVLRGGDGAILQLHLPPKDLGTLSGGDAARHRSSHR